jgi:hypothetical protein
MAQIKKLINKLVSNPKDFTWDELTTVLSHFGYKELSKGKTGGSRRKFADKQNHIINLHKPHPKQILKSYQVRQVVDSLTEKGYIKND